MSLFPTITAQDWRAAIKRSRSERNPVAEQIRKQFRGAHRSHGSDDMGVSKPMRPALN